MLCRLVDQVNPFLFVSGKSCNGQLAKVKFRLSQVLIAEPIMGLDLSYYYNQLGLMFSHTQLQQFNCYTLLLFYLKSRIC